MQCSCSSGSGILHGFTHIQSTIRRPRSGHHYPNRVIRASPRLSEVLADLRPRRKPWRRSSDTRGMTAPRRPGRPARTTPRAFSKDEAAKLFVEGEIASTAAFANRRVFPGPRELARRFGVSPSTMSRFIRRAGLIEIRRAFLAALVPAKCNTEATDGTMDDSSPSPIARQRADT
jgi:hypothetical protein